MKGIIAKYNIRIGGDGTQLAVDKSIAKNPEDLAFVMSHKPEIIAFIKAEEEAKQRAFEERQAKIKAIDGLEEIRAALADVEAWHSEFESSFSDVGGLGVRQKPQYDFDALYAKYPRAAAYLKAESFEYASHYAKSAAGKKAKDRIINGEDHSKVIAEMESEWKSYCDNHLWD